MTERKCLKGPGVTLQGPEEHEGENRYSWLNRNSSISPVMLNVRIHKGSYGLVSAEYDRLSTTLGIYFRDDGYLAISLGQDLNPYLNRVLVTPPQALIPIKALKFKSYSITTKANLYGDFIFVWGEQKKRIHYFALNIAAIGLFDGVDEIHLDGRFYMYQKQIGRLRQKNGNLFPFFISGEVAHGEQFELFERFAPESHASAMELASRIDFQDYPKVTRFLSINIGIGADRAPTPMGEGIEEAQKIFSELFPA